MASHNRHRAAEGRAALPWEDVLLNGGGALDPAAAAAVQRTLRRLDRRADPNRKPMEVDAVVANLIRFVGDWDPATGQASGLLGRCATDPSAISGLRDLRDHLERVYMLGFPVALDAMKAAGERAQDAKQEFGYTSLGVLAGVGKSTAAQNVAKGRSFQHRALERIGVKVLRKRRAERIRVAGLDNVIPMPPVESRRAAGQ